MAVYATLLVVGVLSIGRSHRETVAATRGSALVRLSDATALVAAQINGDHVELLLRKYPEQGLLIKHTQDAWYYVMHDQLRRTTERLGLERPLRIVALDPVSNPTLLVATAETTPELRAPFPGNADAFRNALSNEQYTIDDRANNELLAFDVVRNGGGTAVALVIGSLSADEAGAAADATLWKRIGIAALLYGLAGFVLFGSVGRWLKRDEDLHDALRKKHEHVSDSIAYAAKIQRALVPRPEVYTELFDGSFVIDRPKDVVSGDFHWYHKVDEHTCYVAAADCTGHGLPGAMMAAIGCSLLNEVVPRNTHLDPAELLSMLNSRLMTTLHQHGQKRGAGDGMDLGLCRIDRSRQEILFAGAHRPLYWLHNGRISVINGDRKPIGGAHQETERRYTVHRLAYDRGDRIYLFSDGYVDQFGGPERKRFMSGRLQQMLHDNQHVPMAEQAVLLEAAFTAWQGAEEQVDDVCMLGLAV